MLKNDIKPIKGIIEGVLKDWKKQKVFKKDIVRKTWQKVVGRKAAEHARASSFKTGRLMVEVDESGWIYQLTLKKYQILKKLNKALKDIKISEIQFRIGNFSRGEQDGPKKGEEDKEDRTS